MASKSKLLRVGSVEHRNRNHPLARVILSGLSIEHLGVKFCRGKSRDAISIAWINKRTIAFGTKASSSAREDRDDEVSGDGSVNCSIVRNWVTFDETVFDHLFEFRIFLTFKRAHLRCARAFSPLSPGRPLGYGRNRRCASAAPCTGPEVEALSGGQRALGEWRHYPRNLT